MNKKTISFFIVLILVLASVFAITKNEGIQAGISFGKSNGKFSSTGIDLQTYEIHYFTKDEETSAPFLKVSIGAGFLSINDSKRVGLTAGTFGGYSFGLGSLARFDVSAGAQFFESSTISYLIKKAAKQNDYRISTYIAPATDISAFFGLDTIAVRVGLRSSYMVSNTYGNGFSVTPYVAISGILLNILHII